MQTGIPKDIDLYRRAMPLLFYKHSIFFRNYYNSSNVKEVIDMIYLLIYLFIGNIIVLVCEGILIYTIKNDQLEYLRTGVEKSLGVEFEYNHDFVDYVRTGENYMLLLWPLAIALWLYRKYQLHTTRRD